MRVDNMKYDMAKKYLRAGMERGGFNMEQQKLRPGRFWYGIAAVIFLFGAVSGVWMVFRAVAGIPDQLVRIMIPGSARIELDKSGTFTIYHEYRSYIDGQLYETEGSLNGLTCTVCSESGDVIPVFPNTMSENYSLGSREGEAIFKFTIQNPGSYQITAGYSDGRSHPRAMLAIGRNIVGNMMLAIFAPLTIIGTCTLLAGIIFIVVLIKRSQAKSQTDHEAA